MVPGPVQERPRHDAPPTSATTGAATSLGKKHAAITFEGGWLDPAMTSTYPDVKYAWAVDADRFVRQAR